MARRFVSATMALAALHALVGCASTYHPEYHPESSYSYVHNVTYAQNALIVGGLSAPAPSPAPSAALATAKPTNGNVSSPGGVIVYGDFSGNIYIGH